jgi:hypothetical protein
LHGGNGTFRAERALANPTVHRPLEPRYYDDTTNHLGRRIHPWL